MPLQDSDWAYLGFWVCIFFGFMTLLWWCDNTNAPTAEEREYAQKARCLGKENRARPACWREIDWEVYCERVQCKVSSHK